MVRSIFNHKFLRDTSKICVHWNFCPILIEATWLFCLWKVVINGILESLPQNLIPFFSSWFLDSEVFNAFYEIKVILHHQGWFSFGILLLRPLSFHSMKWLHRVSNFNFKSNFEWDFKSNRPTCFGAKHIF